jgi:suppressor for copper-sensitivity B
MRLPAILLLASLIPADAAGQFPAAPADAGKISKVELLSWTEGTAGTSPRWAGVRVTLREGWKTYWRTPGDAGLPPVFDWSGSVNAQGQEIAWPHPVPFEFQGLKTTGYEGSVTFPVKYEVPLPGQPGRLALKAEILVCSHICFPETHEASFALGTGDAEIPAHVDMIAEAIGKVPVASDVAGVDIRAVPGGAAVGPGFVPASALAEILSPDGKWEPAEASLQPEAGRTMIRVPGAVTGQEFRLTLSDGSRHVEWRGQARSAAGPGLFRPAPAGGTAWPARGLAGLAALAFLGGLILNLMPCVLPVLGLKLAGGVASRRDLASTAAGIIFAFMVLGTTLAAASGLGATMGWGMQFQQPVFVGFLAVLVSYLALSAWGIAPLPAPVNGRGPGGSFMSGALVALLATPCTAPFVGTAVGLAFAGGPAATAVAMVSMGAGMAAPYLLAIAVPPGMWLPAPGKWTVAVKAVGGGLLAATSAWLVAVLAELSGGMAARGVAGFIVLGGSALAARKALRMEGEPSRTTAVAAALSFLGAILVPVVSDDPPERRIVPTGRIEWVDFDRERIGREVSAGRIVFVDATAAWCITCKVNERFVLSTPEVQGLLSGVVAMRADWTRGNPDVGSWLMEHGRAGVPFNSVHGSGVPTGIVLPELLTVSAIRDSLAKAGGSPGR